MRSRLLRAGAVPALAALALFGHPPVAASPMLRSIMCGSGVVVTIPLRRAPRPGEDQPTYPGGCHAACLVRKGVLLGDES
ncbi:hypothetical protein ASE00_14425 [Sphingomonas sp. Root710]|uniref:hypothetical protein n=1 Tax=Sphingomonas sp. Root710 TaxID=1736594 RepID=UPI0006F3E6C6|nr:hypothetical protein [Sphingomonas sp. Root710]KRB81198.1 hypothetical protein ASE00_14425 [Sphingomonas sp. Root710]